MHSILTSFLWNLPFLQLVDIFKGFLTPNLHIRILDLLHRPQNEPLALDLHAYQKRLIIQVVNELIVLLPVLLHFLHAEGRVAKQLLSNVIVYCHKDGSAVVTELDVGVILDANDVALALEALGRVDVDLLLAEVAVLEEHLLIVDARQVRAEYTGIY